MPTPIIGAGAVAGLATESTYGTYAASTRWLPFRSSSINGGPKLERPGHLIPVGVAVSHATPRDLVKVSEEYGGDLEWVPTYDDRACTIMLRHCFHAEPATTGAGPYTHTYELGNSAPGLSIQLLDGTHPTETALARRVDGGVVSSWELAVTAGGFARMRASVIAQGITDPQALSGTIAVASGEEILGAHGAVGGVTWNSLSLFCTDLTIRCDHAMVRTPYVGSYTTAQPARGDFTTITVSAKVYRLDEDLLVGYKAGTSSDLVLTLTGDTSPNAMTITAHLCKITKCDAAIDSAGVLYYQVEWQARGSATDTGLKAVVVNDQSDWE